LLFFISKKEGVIKLKIDGLYFNGKAKELKKYFDLIANIKSGKLKTIACDIDNTVCNVNEILYEKGYDIGHYPNPNLTRDFWLSKDGVEVIFHAKPIKPVLKFAKTLAVAGGSVHFCTSRYEELDTVTYSWLRRNKIRISEDIQFTQRKATLDADIYIEENPLEIEYLSRLNKIVIVPTWDYNKHLEGDNIIHIYIDNQHYKNHLYIDKLDKGVGRYGKKAI
jgi:hypothetical protein